MSKPKPDEFSQKLRAWKVASRVPAGFEREVWQRIAAQQSAREGAFWPSLMRWLSGQFTRPQYAMGLAALTLLSGIGLAHVQARESNARNWKMLEVRYADSVNPLAMAH